MPPEKFLEAVQSALDKGCRATATATLIAAGCKIQQLPDSNERHVLAMRHGELHEQMYGSHDLPV